MTNYFRFLLFAVVLGYFVGCSGKKDAPETENKTPESAHVAANASKSDTKKDSSKTVETVSTKNKVLSELRKALEGNDTARKTHAIMALQYFSETEDLPAIKKALQDKNINVKKAAVYALAGYKNRESLPDIYKILAQEEDDSLKKTALMTLFELNDDGTPAFIIRLLPRLNTYLAALALNLLEKIQPQKDVFTETGRNDLDAFTISGSIGQGNQVKVQVEREFFGVGDSIFGYNIKSIDLKDQKVSLEKDGKTFTKPIDDTTQDEVDKAVEDLNSDNDQKVYAALMRLSALRSNKPAEELLSIVNGRNADDIKLAAIYAIGQSEITQAESALRNVISRSRRSDYIIAAIRALADMGDDSLHTTIEPLIRHADPWVRNAAIAAVGELQLDTCIPALIQRMDDTHSFVRNNAANQLMLFALDGARNIIVGYLESSFERTGSVESVEQKKELIAYLSTLDVEDTYSGGAVFPPVSLAASDTAEEHTASSFNRYHPDFFLLDVGNFGGRNLITITRGDPNGAKTRLYTGDGLDGGEIGEIDPEDESFELFLPNSYIAIISKGSDDNSKAVLLELYQED